MSIIIKIAIILASYVICAYATTDISRLLYGSSQKYITFDSYCPQCKHPLTLADQLPIFSYYINRGKCKYCNAPIPRLDHLLEVGIFLFFVVVNIVFGFSAKAFLFCLIGYEIIKILIVVIKKPGPNTNLRIYGLSVAMNIFIFGIFGFLYFLNNL